MEINKKQKKVELSRSDGDYFIKIKDGKELMNIKISFTKKGFGVQIFRGETPDTKTKPIYVFGDREFIGKFSYISAWKFKKELEKYYDYFEKER